MATHNEFMTRKSKEDRAAQTGMNSAQVDEYIWKMRQRGFKLKDIGAKIGLTEMGVSHALRRIEAAKNRSGN